MNTGFLGPAVATVLTVYGIETIKDSIFTKITSIELQQYLPFTVLKLLAAKAFKKFGMLQQYLPFTVLKRHLI